MVNLPSGASGSEMSEIEFTMDESRTFGDDDDGFTKTCCFRCVATLRSVELDRENDFFWILVPNSEF